MKRWSKTEVTFLLENYGKLRTDKGGGKLRILYLSCHSIQGRSLTDSTGQ